MKKKITFLKMMLLAVVMMVGSVNVWGATVNYAMTSLGLANAQVTGTGSYTVDAVISISFAQNNAGTPPTYYSADGVRLYQNATKGGSMKISVANGYKITDVVVTRAGTAGDGPAGYSIDNTTEAGTFADGTVTNSINSINATSYVEYYSKGTSSGTRTYIASIEVTYVSTGSPCTPSSLAFANSTVTKSVTDAPFTNAATSLNATADITYSSSDAGVASVNPTTGAVVINGAGTATITASQEAGTHNAVDYCAATATYELTVNALAAPVAANVSTRTNTSFLAEWSAVSGADSYELNVYTKEVGANATDLFISEYVEGSGNNKAIEIFNGTGTSVDLSAYTLKQAYNGGGWDVDISYTLPLTGTIAHGDVFVIANDGASETVKEAADLLIAYSATNQGGRVVSFTGNDAMGLFKNNVLIDVFGDPTSSTTIPVAGYTTYGGDHTIVRKSSISNGNTNWTISSGTNTSDSEWIGYAQDTWTYLGSHTFAGGETLTPVTGSPFTVNAPAVSRSITGLSNAEIYFFTVKAVSGAFESALSNEVGPIALLGTGLNSANTAALAWASHGKVMLQATAGETIEIFNVAGQKVLSRMADDGLNTVNVPVKGVVIVKAGNRVSKVIL